MVKMFDPKRISKLELKSDRKTAGIFTLMGLIYTLIAGFVILIFSAQVPQLAMSSMNFMIMMFSAGFAIVFIGLVRYEHKFPDERTFIPALITGMGLIITIQIMLPMFGGGLFNTVFATVVPRGVLGFFLVTQAAFVEELVFCAFFQTAAVALIRRVPDPALRLIYNVVLLGILGGTFMLYHGFVYSSSLISLCMVFIARIIYAVAYAFSDSLDVPFLLHFLNNFAAGLPLLMGGFF